LQLVIAYYSLIIEAWSLLIQPILVYLIMKTMLVGEFKSHLAEAIEEVKAGGEIAVTYGKKKGNYRLLCSYIRKCS